MKALQQQESHYYYSYSDLVDSMEVATLHSQSFGSYQGDTLAIVHEGNRFGLLEYGWGSCSGCDALESCDGNVAELTEMRDRMYNGIQWYDTATELGDYLQNHDWQGSFWSSTLDEVLEFVAQSVTILAQYASSARPTPTLAPTSAADLAKKFAPEPSATPTPPPFALLMLNGASIGVATHMQPAQTPNDVLIWGRVSLYKNVLEIICARNMFEEFMGMTRRPIPFELRIFQYSDKSKTTEQTTFQHALIVQYATAVETGSSYLLTDVGFCFPPPLERLVD